MRKVFLLAFLLFFTIFLFAENNTPTTMQECIDLMDNLFTPEEIKEIELSEDPEMMILYHFKSQGQYIRKHWLTNPQLVAAINFNGRDVTDQDLSWAIYQTYWYSKHGIVFDWDTVLADEEEFRHSHIEPKVFPKNKTLISTDTITRLYIKGKQTCAYLYKDKYTGERYLYDFAIGWIYLTEDEYIHSESLTNEELAVFLLEKEPLKE